MLGRRDKKIEEGGPCCKEPLSIWKYFSKGGKHQPGSILSMGPDGGEPRGVRGKKGEVTNENWKIRDGSLFDVRVSSRHSHMWDR